ncbi:MAG: BlaI/MecI/CopY family transcriptional regulator [Saprospirales bacterium]|nr:MAG: BlaI/MecI/CopY family transcriptional regulator [Saprospirales bacterium]
MNQRLTSVEEEIMHHIWDMKECTVREIINKMGDPDTPHSTVSSVVRILEKKGFVDHKAYGRTHLYFPVIERDYYLLDYLENLEEDFFKGSTRELVSFLIREEKLSMDDLREIMNLINKSDEK